VSGAARPRAAPSPKLSRMQPHAVNVGILLPQRPDDLGAWLSRAAAFDAAGAYLLVADLATATDAATDTADADAKSAGSTAQPDLDPVAVLAALAVTTSRALLVTSTPLGPARSTIERLSRGRLRTVTDLPGNGVRLEGELWATTPVPENRAAWRAAVDDAAERGLRGLLVPADPRLIDLLRNPGEPGERRDLELAQG